MQKAKSLLHLSMRGRYLLVAEHEENTPKSALADKQMGSVFLTFEAQLN